MMGQQPPATPETEDGQNLDHVLLFYRENGIPTPTHYPYPMPDLDVGNLKHDLVYPREKAVIGAPSPTALTMDSKNMTLATIHAVAGQLLDTWEQFKKHRSCRLPIVRNLIVMFIRSVHWQFYQVLQAPLFRLRNDLGPMMGDRFTGRLSPHRGPTLRTYADVFADIQLKMRTLIMQVHSTMKFQQIQDDKKEIPTRCPRDILLEIALWNKLGPPTPEKLKNLKNPRVKLDLPYEKIDEAISKQIQELNAANIAIEIRPKYGVPLMNHVAVHPSGSQWYVGSTCAQFRGLQDSDALNLVKDIRNKEIDPAYRNFHHASYDPLKYMEAMFKAYTTLAKAIVRRKMTKGFQAMNFHRVLDMSSHMGISLNQNLSIRVNCWRCHTLYNFQENTGGREQNEIGSEYGHFEFNRPADCCAEVVSSLRALIAKNEREKLLNDP